MQAQQATRWDLVATRERDGYQTRCSVPADEAATLEQAIAVAQAEFPAGWKVDPIDKWREPKP